MRIWIVGAGAIGLLYGSRLAQSSVKVTLLTGSAAQAAALAAGGITIEEYGTGAAARAAVDAAPLAGAHAIAGPRDWIWLTVKQPHLTDDLAASLAALCSGGASLLCLQNGVGHMEKLREAIPERQLYAAISTEGALRLDEVTVRHTGLGSLTFGRWGDLASDDVTISGQDGSQKMLLDILEAAGIEGSMSNDMNNRIYHKLLVNAVINPLTAIYGVTNGELPDNDSRKRLMIALHAESEAVLSAAGMSGDGDAWERLMTVCRRTASNESSMLRDVKAGRMTEIDWINGGVAAIARQYGLTTPLNDAIITIVKTLAMN
ncbi:2-dehydropantoate 2-reductase [Paenibacillus oenotherae]|uniref:2-dehydropantoate 2-reductase n=1 Tax=Paenibacillus oenotherae TaxID=1435645 RepID=A0ABS7D1E8_9BACL|nr:2-dehydropantoate 2-reductase [Paenibacillus oenotherae]